MSIDLRAATNRHAPLEEMENNSSIPLRYILNKLDLAKMGCIIINEK